MLSSDSKSHEKKVHALSGKERRKKSYLPQKPLEIPSNPQKKYKDSGWINYADWMGY